MKKIKYSKPQVIAQLLENKNKKEIIDIFGHSNYHSEYSIWSYNLVKNLFFRREMVLFFNDIEVANINITDYFLGNKIREYFY